MQALDGCNIQATAKQYQERCKMAWELYPRRYSLWAEQNLTEEKWAGVQQLAQRWAALGKGQRLDLGVPGLAEIAQQDTNEDPVEVDIEAPAGIIQDEEDDIVQVRLVDQTSCTALYKCAITSEHTRPFAKVSALLDVAAGISASTSGRTNKQNWTNTNLSSSLILLSEHGADAPSVPAGWDVHTDYFVQSKQCCAALTVAPEQSGKITATRRSQPRKHSKVC